MILEISSNLNDYMILCAVWTTQMFIVFTNPRGRPLFLSDSIPKETPKGNSCFKETFPSRFLTLIPFALLPANERRINARSSEG